MYSLCVLRRTSDGALPFWRRKERSRVASRYSFHRAWRANDEVSLAPTVWSEVVAEIMALPTRKSALRCRAVKPPDQRLIAVPMMSAQFVHIALTGVCRPSMAALRRAEQHFVDGYLPSKFPIRIGLQNISEDPDHGAPGGGGLLRSTSSSFALVSLPFAALMNISTICHGS